VVAPLGLLLPFREVGEISHWIDGLERFPCDPGPVVEPVFDCSSVVAILPEP
jgi:hypothetical protein